MRQKYVHVAFQFVAHLETVYQLGNKLLLLDRECIRVGGVDCGEIVVEQFVALAVDFHRSRIEVYMMEQPSVVHLPFRMAANHISFQLPLNHRYSLVHLGRKASALQRKSRTAGTKFWREYIAGVLSISLHCECGQRHQIDAVAILKSFHIAVSQTDPDGIGDTRLVA